MSIQTRSTDDNGKLKSLWYRWRALGGYLLLVCAIGYAITDVQDTGKQGRLNLQHSAQIVTLDSCKRDNNTRAAVRKIIRRGDKELSKYLDEKFITKTQYRRAKHVNKDALALLQPANCVAQSKQIRSD